MAGKPGRSGRKRQGSEPKVYFNSRIDPELRDRLQAEADRNGRTLSREIELRLRGTFKPTNPTTDATRVLSFLFEEAARLTTVGDKNWRNDENLYLAFRTAVRELLDIALVPSAPWRPRSQWDEIEHPLFKNPDDLGRAAIFQITNELTTAEDLASVADLNPDDPRREYANAAQFLSHRAGNYSSRYRQQKMLENDPEYQALQREMEERLAAQRDQATRARKPASVAWHREWMKRMDAVHARYPDYPEREDK